MEDQQESPRLLRQVREVLRLHHYSGGVPCARRVHRPAQRRGAAASRGPGGGQQGDQGDGAPGGIDQGHQRAQFQAQLCDASPAAGHGHPHHPGAAGSCRPGHHDDLHACDSTRRAGGPQPVGRSPTNLICAFSLCIGGSLAYIWRTPSHPLSSTYTTPIRHLSDTYPTRSGCVKITHSGQGDLCTLHAAFWPRPRHPKAGRKQKVESRNGKGGEATPRPPQSVLITSR